MSNAGQSTQAKERRNRASGLAALQGALRQNFAERPVNRALAESLQIICRHMEATYAVIHTRLGVHLLSEEWVRPGQTIDTAIREEINQVLWVSVSTEEARCLSLTVGDKKYLVLGIVMYDSAAEASGGAAIMIDDCERGRVLEVMAQFEGVLGYLALLTDVGMVKGKKLAERRELAPHAAADHPMRLAKAMVMEIEARYGFDLTAVGFVRDTRVEIVAISGVDVVREANPGVAAMRVAMEECLDRRDVIVHMGRDTTESDNCRLHAQWSALAHGSPVASIPLVCTGEIVAIVSMCQGAGSPLTGEQVQLIAEEMSGYAALVPLSQAATRSVLAHALHSTRLAVRQALGRGRRRAAATVLGVAAAAYWLAFGTLHYTFTVPCTVHAVERRTIACPRSGVLAGLFVRPGDRVREGQVLAEIDASEDYLRRTELVAEIESLGALIDQAIAKRESGDVRVNEARRRSLQAQLGIVDANIAQAQIRAPQEGIILAGELRERLGSRIEVGMALFEVARNDSAEVMLRIPEALVLAAHECAVAEFAPASRPDYSYRLEGLRIAPASTVVDGRNVFLAEARVAFDIGSLPPGMEGAAYLDAGPRSVFWVLTHRFTDWLHLNFWL